MHDFKYKGLDIYHAVDSQMDIIIESFVEVYGEDYRSHIEENLNSMICLAYAGDVESEYLENKIEELKEAQNRINTTFKEQFGITIDMALNVKNGREITLANGSNYINLLRKGQYLPGLTDEEKKCFQGSFNSNREIMEWFRNKQNCQNMKNVISRMADHNLVSMYLDAKLKTSYCETAKNFHETSKNSTGSDFEERKNEILAQRLEQISKGLNNFNRLDVNIDVLEELLGWSKQDLETELKKNSLFAEETFPDFCKAVGYKFDNIEDCLKNEEFMSLLFDERFRSNWQNFNNKVNFKTEKVAEILKENNIPEHSIEQSVNYIKNNEPISGRMAFVDTCVDLDGNKRTICNIPNLMVKDSWLVMHELGHVVDSITIKDTEDKLVYKSGFIINELEKNGEQEFKSYRVTSAETGYKFKNEIEDMQSPYVNLNEIMNDYLTKLATEKLEAKGGVLGGVKFEHDRQHSMYTSGFDVFVPFIEKNFDKLMKCRKAGKEYFDMVEEYFGWDNFNKLADLATWYTVKKGKFTYEDMLNPSNEQEIKALSNQAAEEMREIERSIQLRKQEELSM